MLAYVERLASGMAPEARSLRGDVWEGARMLACVERLASGMAPEARSVREGVWEGARTLACVEVSLRRGS